MHVTVEEVDATRRRIAVEVPVEAVTAEMDRAFGRVQRHAHIKGFRPGHVPRAVLEKYFGDQVRADVLSHLIEHSYSDALTQSGLKPVSSPEIVPETLEAGRPLRYSAMVDIRPTVAIREHRGLPARRPRRAVSEEDVARAVEALRESLATLRPIEGRAEARDGDFAAVDTVASIDGKTLPNGKRENRLIEIGRGTVPAEIDRALAGMTVGEMRSVNVPFAADHPDRQVAGRVVRFDITLRSIRERVLPEANDDLAKEHGECETLAELRARLRERIGESFVREAEENVREQLIDELIRRNSFPVPQSLVDRQLESLFDELAARLGVSASDLKKDPTRVEKLAQELRPRAERQVRAVFALDVVAELEGVSVSDDEVEKRIAEFAARAGEQEEKLRAAVREPVAREELRSRIARERALETIAASARIEDVEPPANVVAPVVEKG